MASKITSKDAKSMLKISDCKFMHLLERDVLRAEKEGCKYLYLEDDLREYKKVKDK